MSRKKIWEKTVMEWVPDYLRWTTNVPLAKGSKVKPRNQRSGETYELSKLKIVSVPDSGELGFAVATFDVGGNMLLADWARKHLLKLLKEKFSAGKWKDRWFRAVTGEYGPGFKVSFRLEHDFADEAFGLARELARLLDVNEERAGEFVIWRETMHSHGAGFFPDTQHFKIRRGIRIYEEIPVELMPSLTEMTP